MTNSKKAPKSKAHKKEVEQNKKNIFLSVGIFLAVIVVGIVVAVVSTTDNNSGDLDNSQPNLPGSDDISQNGVIAKVNGEEITSQEVSQIQNELSTQGQEVTQEQAVQQAVTVKVLEAEVESGGYLLSTEEVETQLSSQLSQQGMSLEEFKTQVENSGSSYEDALDNYRFQFSIEHYFSEVLDTQSIEVTQEEVEQFYQQYTQQAQAQGQEVQELEEIRSQLEEQIRSQKESQLRNQHIQSLVEQADVEYI